MAGIFKAYDIRGIYGEELTEDLARAIGRALATFLGCRKVAVGRDIRPHSAPLFAASAPCKAYRLSLVTSPCSRSPRPGPGKGWRETTDSGTPSARPRARTSSL